MATISPACSVSDTSTSRSRAGAVCTPRSTQTGGAGGGRALRPRLDRAADHPLGQLARLPVSPAPAFGHQAAAAQHRDALRHAQHLAELVADEDDRQALRHHLAQHLEQRLASCGVSTAVGSSRIRMRAPRYQRLQDLHALALAHRQRATRASGSTARPKRRATSSSRARGAGAAREGLPQRLGAQHHVVQHAQVVASVKCWCTMPMPAASAARLARRQRLAERLDRCPASAT